MFSRIPDSNQPRLTVYKHAARLRNVDMMVTKPEEQLSLFVSLTETKIKRYITWFRGRTAQLRYEKNYVAHK